MMDKTTRTDIIRFLTLIIALISTGLLNILVILAVGYAIDPTAGFILFICSGIGWYMFEDRIEDLILNFKLDNTTDVSKQSK